MSLIGALTTGQSALSSAQASIQVSGNNISNASNANYTEEVAQIGEGSSQQIQPGIFVGDGAELDSIQRQADQALTNRLNSSISDNQAAQTTSQWLTQVQSVFNALGTSNLSTSMSSFFSAWSTLASSPQDMGDRQVVIQQGQALAQEFNSQIQQLQSLQTSVSSNLSSQVSQADNLASQIASLNQQIVTAQAGTSGSDNSLLDQRDAAISKLSQYVNVTTAQQPDGSMNVYVGSQPLVDGVTSNGLTMQNQDVNGTITPTVVFKNNNAPVPLNGGGQLGALSDMQVRIGGVVGQMNTLAGQVISQVNQVYASGQGLHGVTSATATNTVTDTTQPLDSAAAGLTFPPTNGSFVVHVTDPTTGQSTSTLVQVNLTGSANDTTLDSLTASLNAISGVQATDTGGVLKISSTNGNDQISFSQDSSGALASLGVNTFFTGTDATDIAVNNTVASQPALLNAAQNGDPADNQTALTLASLATQPIASLGGASLNDTYQSMINGVATQLSSANSNAQAAQSVQTTLQSQRDSLSGVSIDNETINLLKQQQVYQGGAQLINIVNQLMQTLIYMVR